MTVFKCCVITGGRCDHGSSWTFFRPSSTMLYSLTHFVVTHIIKAADLSVNIRC